MRRTRRLNRIRILAIALGVLALALLVDVGLLRQDSRLGWMQRLSPRVLRTISRAVPNDAVTWAAIGVRQRHRGDSQVAEISLARAAELSPSFTAARGERSLALIDLGRDTQAYPIIQECLGENGDLVPALLAKGRLHANRREWEKAAQYGDYAMKIDPSQPDAWLLRARILESRGDLPGAERAAGRCLQIAPRWWQAWTIRGRAALGRGGAADAVTYAERAVSLNPADTEGRVVLGRALLARGEKTDVERAEATLRAAVAVDPFDPEAHMALAETLVRLNRHAEARALLEDNLRRWPEENSARTMLIHLSRGASRAREARAWEREFLRWQRFIDAKAIIEERLQKTRYGYEEHLALARLYSGMGMLDEAWREAQQGIRSGPSPTGLALLARIRRQYAARKSPGSRQSLRKQAGGGDAATSN